MKKILLIEDNLEMRENTAEILELANFKVYTAENGKRGVDMVQQIKPDLIICDVMMPELDGFGVLHILSKSPDTASIPFIFLTAKTEKSDFRKGMNLGADDYLTKPFDDVELLDAIEIRFKKSEIIHSKFENSVEGLNHFFNEARGVEELKKLSENRESKTYRKKELIFHEGRYPNKLFYIASGKVKTFKMNEDGKEYITGIHKSGDFIGYLSLLQETTYAESAMAMEETELYIIPKQDFFTLIYSNRDVSNKFIKMIANDLLETEERLLKLAYDSVRKRVAEALLYLQNKYHEENPEEDFSISILREDLASIVGTAKESVIRTLSDFKDEKLISIESGMIIITDIKGLERMHN